MERERPRPRDGSEAAASASQVPETSPTPLISAPAEDAAPPGVRVQGSPLRCPYCHDAVDPNAADWVACRACLARHHSECWGEGGACGACGSDHRLVMEASASEPEPAWESVDAADYWRARARQRASERETRDAARGGASDSARGGASDSARAPRRGGSARRSGSARRPVPRAVPLDDPAQRYLNLQAFWTLLAGLLALTVHPWLALMGGGLGLLSTVQLRLEARHDPTLTAAPTASSALLVLGSFACAAHALATNTSAVACVGLTLLALLTFALSRVLSRRPRR